MGVSGDQQRRRFWPITVRGRGRRRYMVEAGVGDRKNWAFSQDAKIQGNEAANDTHLQIFHCGRLCVVALEGLEIKCKGTENENNVQHYVQHRPKYLLLLFTIGFSNLAQMGRSNFLIESNHFHSVLHLYGSPATSLCQPVNKLAPLLCFAETSQINLCGRISMQRLKD